MTELLSIAALALIALGAMIIVEFRRAGEKQPFVGLALACLTAINFAAMAGLGWAVFLTVPYDGFMIETTFLIVPAMILLLLMIAANRAYRRGRTGKAVSVSLLGAVPSLAVYFVSLYVVANGIDMR